ncbi:MAG: tetratricopeptide repeat protein, partial [Roseiflexaceae bacterium]
VAQARKGEHLEAIWASMQGLSIARDFGYRHDICLALSNLGNAYVERGRLWDAIACYEEALQVALRLDDCRIGVKLLRDLGAAYRVLAYAEGQDAPPHHYLQQAEAYYRQSGELARQIGDLWGASATYWRQDELSLSLEDHEASAGLDPVGHLGCPQQDQG